MCPTPTFSAEKPPRDPKDFSSEFAAGAMVKIVLVSGAEVEGSVFSVDPVSKLVVISKSSDMLFANIR
jgi:hypothetical protein